MFIHFSQIFDWASGPKIITFDDIKKTKLPIDEHGKIKCNKIWDTTAQFLFPWQPGNAFHSMNDNSLYVLTHIIWQYVTSFDTNFGSSHEWMNVTNEESLLHIIRHIIPQDRTLFLL